MDSKHKIVAGIAATLVGLLFCFWILGFVTQLLAPRYIYIEHPSPPYDISRDTELEYLYRIPYPIVTKSENPVNISAENIAIVIVLSEGKERDYYQISLDFLDEKIDITFYDRHFIQEIAIGSYIARNTPYALEIIKDFGEYETKLPVGSFHGTENGALHLTEVPNEPIFPVPMSYTHWYNPFLGDFDLDRCALGNTTWNHDPKFIGTRKLWNTSSGNMKLTKKCKKSSCLNHSTISLTMELIENRSSQH
ncbi:hypothetical protein CAEBREN_00638 [Caenorhabditis brenneri]|uniref:Uncharacterized protein n=1 Tax=Caenorhabditis brenneri TaxID=135651 RepID=G0NWA2_CAEBE|nr:hypothetical protein CAEBREN_00638 [Caenorhabditis brenneri]